MYMQYLPTEILQKILEELDGADLVRCRYVCDRWCDAIDGLSDSAWQRICQHQTYAEDYIASQTKYGLSWRDTYRALNSWSRISKSRVNHYKLCSGVQRVLVLKNGIIACFQNYKHPDHLQQNVYSDTIIYYDLKKTKIIDIDECEFLFSCQQCEINDQFMVVVLESGCLCVIPNDTSRQLMFLGMLKKFKESEEDYFEGFTVIDEKIYFKHSTNNVVYESKLVNKHGRTTISRKRLEAFKNNRSSLDESVIAYSCKNGNVNMLTDRGNIYVHMGADLLWVGNYDYPGNYVFAELEEYGFDWRNKSIFEWLVEHSSNYTHPPSCEFYAHVRYKYGFILLLASRFKGKLKIFNYNKSLTGFSDLQAAITQKPARTMELKHFISQLDVVETAGSHHVIILRHGKVVIYEFLYALAPYRNRKRVAPSSNQNLVTKQPKAG